MADDETHIGRNNEERKEDENRRIMGKALEGAAAETVQRFGSADNVSCSQALCSVA